MSWTLLDPTRLFDHPLLGGASKSACAADPFARFFEGITNASRQRSEFPPLNIYGDESRVVVRSEVAGVDADSLSIEYEDGVLEIRGRRGGAQPAKADEQAAEGPKYRRRERPSGEFHRSVRLPYPAQAEGITATYERGVLEIVVPRAEADLPRSIEVKHA